MRRMSVFIVLAVFAVLIAACGGNAGGKSQATQTNEPSTNAANNAGQPTASEASGEVNIFTARHYEVDDQLYSKFTEQTGIKVNVVKGTAEELIERLKREGSSTSADLFITVDGGVLNKAKEVGVLQPIQSDVVNRNVPEKFRDRENYWVGLSTRARVIVYHPDRVKPKELSTYEDLASEKWKGRILVRSSNNLYNQSLLASLIELNGEEAAEQWAKGIVANMARPPEGSDRDQAKAVVAGIGDVAIMNTYYVGLLINSKDPEEAKVGQTVRVFFPNQQTTGTHVNISGIGLTKHSKNKENAIKLIEYLTGREAQHIASSQNFEYPVNPQAEKADLLKSWGDFKMQEIDWAALGRNNPKAVQIFDKAGWK